MVLRSTPTVPAPSPKSSESREARTPSLPTILEEEVPAATPGSKMTKKEKRKLFKKAQKLQKEIFAMTYQKVIQQLEAEKYIISEHFKKTVSPEAFYEKVVQKDHLLVNNPIEWEAWLRNEIVTELQALPRRRLTNQDLIDRFIRESIRCQ